MYLMFQLKQERLSVYLRIFNFSYLSKPYGQLFRSCFHKTIIFSWRLNSLYSYLSILSTNLLRILWGHVSGAQGILEDPLSSRSSNLPTVDEICENGRFPVSKSFVTFSNSELFSCSETRINPWIRSSKKNLSEWAQHQKAIGCIYLTTKCRSETPQPAGLEFDNYKPMLKSGISKCTSLRNGLNLGGGGWSRFSDRGGHYLSNEINNNVTL